MELFDAFKKTNRRSTESKYTQFVSDIFFRISFDNYSRALLDVVDGHGNVVDVDYRNYTGNVFQLLRSIYAVKAADSSRIMWDGLNHGIYLDEYPQMMYQLIRCSNVISEKDSKVSAQSGLYQVSVNLRRDKNNWVPDFSLKRKDGGGPYVFSDFKLLTDSYALSDDMGLGKTVQAISLLLYAHKAKKTSKPSLVVMPRTLLFNWSAELTKFAPDLSFSTYYGQTRDFEKCLESQVVLTTYALVRNDIEKFKDAEFNCIILDESQNIKNLTAKVAQAVMLLNAEHRFALSGTPLENRLTELYSLFRFLNPGMFGSAEDFNTRYVLPIQKDDDKDVLQHLKSRIHPFLLRRVKEEVLDDLPERIDQTIYVEMDDAQAQFYEMRRRYYYDAIKSSIREEGAAKSQFIMFQALNELRRVASVPESLSDGQVVSAKIPAIADALTEAVDNGHKVVVFFNFIAGIEILGEELEKNHINYVVMTGSTVDRQSVVDRFQNDNSCQVLLMTLKTGGVGLNLTAADTVFIAEPWWNKAAEEQAVGRLHRIGQKSVVHSFSVITSQTIEERILQLQQQKSSLVEALISSDSSTSKVLTEEDIDFILG